MCWTPGNGVQLAHLLTPANKAEAALAMATWQTMPRRFKRQVKLVIADKMRDSRQLCEAFTAKGVNLLVAPHRRSVRNKWQDGGRLHLYHRRWHVDGAFARLLARKRIQIRCDRDTMSFNAFVTLVFTMIAPSQFATTSIEL